MQTKSGSGDGACFIILFAGLIVAFILLRPVIDFIRVEYFDLTPLIPF